MLVEMDPLASTCLNGHPVWDAPNACLFSFPFSSNPLNGHDADVLIATFDESIPHVPSELRVLLFRLTWSEMFVIASYLHFVHYRSGLKIYAFAEFSRMLSIDAIQF
jgi:hypothetical protein